MLVVLLALLLCAVPVVAARSLMLRSADSVRLATQQAFAGCADVTNTFERFHAEFIWRFTGLWNSWPMAPSENSLGVGCANAAQDLMRWQRFGLAHLHCHEVVHSALLNASICPSKVCRVA